MKVKLMIIGCVVALLYCWWSGLVSFTWITWAGAARRNCLNRCGERPETKSRKNRTGLTRE